LGSTRSGFHALKFNLRALAQRTSQQRLGEVSSSWARTRRRQT